MSFNKVVIFSSILYASLVLCGCVNRGCYKNYIKKHERFSFVQENIDPAKSYIEFKGDVQLEYVDGKLEYTNRVVWESCTRYLVVFQSDGRDGFWKAGDTLSIDVLGKVKDTLNVIASAKGGSFSMKLYKL